jgi:hypothetical protein
MDKRHPSSFQQLEKLGEGTYATVRGGDRSGDYSTPGHYRMTSYELLYYPAQIQTHTDPNRSSKVEIDKLEN